MVEREGGQGACAVLRHPPMLVTGHGSRCLEPYSPKGLRVKKGEKSIVSRVSAIGIFKKSVIPRVSAFWEN